MGKNRRIYLIFLFILMGSLYIHISGLSNQSTVKTETIHEIGSFPPEDEDSIYLYRSLYMDKDPSGNIYISNSKDGNVYSFSSKGDYLATIGTKGRGPEELSSPANILTMKDQIIVYDRGNRRMQMFDMTGKALSYFRLSKTYRDIVLDEKKMVFYAAPMLSGDPKENLVDVLSNEGELLASFGTPIEFKHKRSTFNSARLAVMDNGELLLGFEFLPIIRRYSPEGQLLAEHKIDYGPATAKGKENLASYKRSLAKRTNPGLYKIFENIIVEKGRIFLLTTSSFNVTILEYDNALSLRNMYTGKTLDEHPFFNDFVIMEKGGQKLFYLLQVMPENVVNIFRQNNSFPPGLIPHNWSTHNVSFGID